MEKTRKNASSWKQGIIDVLTSTEKVFSVASLMCEHLEQKVKSVASLTC